MTNDHLPPPVFTPEERTLLIRTLEFMAAKKQYDHSLAHYVFRVPLIFTAKTSLMLRSIIQKLKNEPADT